MGPQRSMHGHELVLGYGREEKVVFETLEAQGVDAAKLLFEAFRLKRAQEDLGRLCDELLALVAAGRLRDGVTRTLAFEDLPHGLHDLRESRARGKIVCTVP